MHPEDASYFPADARNSETLLTLLTEATEGKLKAVKHSTTTSRNPPLHAIEKFLAGHVNRELKGRQSNWKIVRYAYDSSRSVFLVHIKKLM